MNGHRTVFSVPDGTRCRIRTASLGLATRRAAAMRDTQIEFTAVATGRFETAAGTVRRCFEDVRPPIAGVMTEAWLRDGELSGDFEIEDAHGPPARLRRSG